RGRPAIQDDPMHRRHEPQRERRASLVATERALREDIPAGAAAFHVVGGMVEQRSVQRGAQLTTPPSLLPEQIRRGALLGLHAPSGPYVNDAPGCQIISTRITRTEKVRYIPPNCSFFPMAWSSAGGTASGGGGPGGMPASMSTMRVLFGSCTNTAKKNAAMYSTIEITSHSFFQRSMCPGAV